jgi:hypothetical protein
MKRIFLFLAALLINSAFAPLNAADLSELTYQTRGGEVTVTDCNAAVTGIGGRGFRSLGSITIPHGITGIELEKNKPGMLPKLPA